MRDFLKNYLALFEYPTESHSVFLSEFDKIYNNKEYLLEFNSLLKRYVEDMNCDYIKLIDDCDVFSEKCGVNPFTFKTIFHLFMAEILKGYYAEKNIPESYWYNSMLDIKYQTLTTYLERGVWGASCTYWFIGFFRLTRFSFGRLQIEIIDLGKDYGREYNKNGLKLGKGSKIFNVHIPKTGTKLDEEECNKSYEDAMRFYKKYFGFDCNIFFCHTWLLFPDNLQVVRPDSNIAKFINDYDIFDVEIKDDYSEVHRIFDMPFDGDTSKLPADNSLRRAYIKWINEGKKIGCGCGIYIHNK